MMLESLLQDRLLGTPPLVAEGTPSIDASGARREHNGSSAARLVPNLGSAISHPCAAKWPVGWPSPTAMSEPAVGHEVVVSRRGITSFVNPLRTTSRDVAHDEAVMV